MTTLSTEELIGMLTNIAENMSDPHWELGDKLTELKRAGYKLDYLAEICEPIFGIKRSAIFNHYRTSLIFPEDQRALELNWSIHERCGRAVKRITRTEDYGKAHEWLAKVSGGTYTYTSLVDAMKANSGDEHKPDPVYLCKRVPAELFSVTELKNGTSEVVLHVDRETGNDLGVALGMYSLSEILLTMFIPAPEVHTSELEETAA